MKLDKFKFAVFLLSAIIFLWSYQLPLGAGNVPIYVVFSIISILFYSVDFLFFIFLSGGLLIHFLTSLLFGPGFENVYKSVFGYILLDAVLVSTSSVFAFLISEKALEKAFYNVYSNGIYALFILQLIQIVFQFLGLYESGYYHYFLPIPRVSGFFYEPSHFAIALSPLIFYIVVFYRRFIEVFGVKFFSVFVFSCFFDLSSTLFLIFLLSFFSRFIIFYSRSYWFPVGVIFAIILVCFSAGLLFYYSPDFSDRLSTLWLLVFQGENPDTTFNPSSLLFYKGLESMLYSAENYPLGVGMLNMSSISIFSSVSQLNDFYEEQNSHDGTSMLFKMLSEFGFFSIVLFFGLVKVFNKVKISSIEKAYFQSEYLVLLCFVFPIISSMVRGSSYFDGGVILSISILLGIVFRNRMVSKGEL
tara:strand:+ start:10816 stop:12063 length:1248 start_codon:yes stop_codon:yes gene_type:complete